MDWKFWRLPSREDEFRSEIAALQQKLIAAIDDAQLWKAKAEKAERSRDWSKHTISATMAPVSLPFQDDGVRMQLSEMARLLKEAEFAHATYEQTAFNRHRSLVSKLARLRADLLANKKVADPIDKPSPSEEK